MIQLDDDVYGRTVSRVDNEDGTSTYTVIDVPSGSVFSISHASDVPLLQVYSTITAMAPGVDGQGEDG